YGVEADLRGGSGHATDGRRDWTIEPTAFEGVVAQTTLQSVVAVATLLVLDRLYPPALERYANPSTMVLDERGAILRAFTTPDQAWRLKTRPSEVDPVYLAMLQAYEDKRFSRHWGVDPAALSRALWQWARAGHIVSGGSTLTMQTARLLTPRPRTLAGKASEMLRALQLEHRFAKAEILSIYLTLAPFGGNLEGVRAAALAYFGKEPNHLTRGEAALLVALPQSPERARPDLHPEAARRARDKVLHELAKRGAIGASEMAEAAAEALPRQRAALPFLAPQLAAELAATATSGAAIRTTLDGRLERRVEELARREPLEEGASLAVLVVENRGRKVRVEVGSADFAAPFGQIDMTRAKRSPGSTLKPFIYGMGFDAVLVHPDTIVEDAPLRLGDYAPQNFDREYHGEVTVRAALQRSLNIPAVALLSRLGAQRFVTAVRGAGAELAFDDGGATPSLAIALGGVGISLRDLVMLYAALADGGMARPLVFRAETPAGHGTPLVTPASAWYVSDILRGVVPPEPLVRLPQGNAIRPIAFKTGTSYGFRDAWTIGYSERYTVGVWVGRPDGAPRPGHYGIVTAAPLLFKVFGLLPPEETSDSQPPGVIASGGARVLPVALRRFSPSGPQAAFGQRQPASPLRILFPPQGAKLELEPEADRFAAIALKAAGGTQPLNWIVDGKPVATTKEPGDVAFFAPDGAGFSTLSVIDATGETVSETVRLGTSE
ncbi:MAG: penicillin-binding protein 1C, partial [Alphaproteobacteria bacterium]